jgi:hypothetical protein
MDELLKALQDGAAQIKTLCQGLVNATNYAHNVQNEAEVKLKAANDLDDRNRLIANELAIRMNKLEKIESVVALEESAQDIMVEVKALQAKLEAERSTFEQASAKTSHDLSAKANQILTDQETIDKQWGELRTAQAVLEEQKKNMKETVIKELTARK